MKITRDCFSRIARERWPPSDWRRRSGRLFLRSAAFAAEPARRSGLTGGAKVLLCIFQRGAVDGISMVVPHGDPAYYQHRQEGANGIAIPRTGADGAIDLDGMFGLHPMLAPLKPIYTAGHLAPIHAGSPNTTRSHFDAQDYMEAPRRATSRSKMDGSRGPWRTARRTAPG